MKTLMSIHWKPQFPYKSLSYRVTLHHTFVSSACQNSNWPLNWCGYVYGILIEVPKKLLTNNDVSVFFSGLVKRKMLVLDLDETLIHSHHDAMLRPTVKPGTPPDFVLKVTIDKHPVRFFVHKRPHVDYFLNIVSWVSIYISTQLRNEMA